jgi:hypothetical protein
MVAVVTDPEQRAALVRQLYNNPVYVEITTQLKQQQVDVFLSGAPVTEVLEAQAIAAALKKLDDRFRTILDTERMSKQRKDKALHRYADRG